MLWRNKSLPHRPHLVVGKKIKPNKQNMNDTSDYDDDKKTTLQAVVEEEGGEIPDPDQQQHVNQHSLRFLMRRN